MVMNEQLNVGESRCLMSAGGGLLEFWNEGILMSNNFLRLSDNQTSFFKDSK